MTEGLVVLLAWLEYAVLVGALIFVVIRRSDRS